MLRSMTAFSRESHISPLGVFTLEIQSINRKFFELNLCLPKEISFLENLIREKVQKKTFRGKIHLSVIFEPSDDSPPILEVRPNVACALRYKNACLSLQRQLGIEDDKFAFSLLKEVLLQEKDIFSVSHPASRADTVKEEFFHALDKALNGLVVMKEKEGQYIQQDFILCLDRMQKNLSEVQQLSSRAPQKYRKRLEDRIKEILPNVFEHEERLLREVCIFAEKVDIHEEITRFFSHIEQFRSLMISKSIQVGKTLEFIIQEMLREINTIAAKSSDLEVSKTILSIKGDLEKLREQVHNIE